MCQPHGSCIIGVWSIYHQTKVSDITVNDFDRTGIFTLTSERGLPEIGQCRERGFHQHTKTPPLFDVSPWKTSSYHKVICIFIFHFSYVWLGKHFKVYWLHKNNFFIMGLMLHFSFTKSNICWANTFIYKLMTLIQCFQNCAHVSVVDTERIEMVDLRQKWCHRPYPQDCVWRQNPHYFNWCHCKCIEPCALLSLAFKHLIYINQYFLCLFYKSVYMLLKLAVWLLSCLSVCLCCQCY